jgi:hypothetical protein
VLIDPVQAAPNVAQWNILAGRNCWLPREATDGGKERPFLRKRFDEHKVAGGRAQLCNYIGSWD